MLYGVIPKLEQRLMLNAVELKAYQLRQVPGCEHTTFWAMVNTLTTANAVYPFKLYVRCNGTLQQICFTVVEYKFCSLSRTILLKDQKPPMTPVTSLIYASKICILQSNQIVNIESKYCIELQGSCKSFIRKTNTHAKYIQYLVYSIRKYNW